MAVEEVVAVSLALALRGQSVTFDTAGHVVEVGELAAVVAGVHELGSDAVRRRRDPAVTPDRYVGDQDSWDRQVAAVGLEPESLTSIVRRTSHWLAGGDHVGRVDDPTAVSHEGNLG